MNRKEEIKHTIKNANIFEGLSFGDTPPVGEFLKRLAISPTTIAGALGGAATGGLLIPGVEKHKDPATGATLTLSRKPTTKDRIKNAIWMSLLGSLLGAFGSVPFAAGMKYE